MNICHMPKITNYPDSPDIESSTKDYQNRFSGAVGEWFVDVQSRATRNIIMKLGAGNSLNVADVGGGHGQSVDPILDMGHHLTIIASIDECKNIIKPILDKQLIEFKAANIFDMPYKDNSFDVVISYRMLAHLQDWEKYIKELARISSRLVIVDFASKRSVNFFANALFGLKQKVEKNTRHYKLFLEKEIIKAFASHGFVPLYKVGQFVLPMALHRAMNQKFLSIAFESVFKIIGFSYLFSSPVIFGFVKKEQVK